MKRDRLDQIIRDAVLAGILPADATRPAPGRPWPLVLLTALGAWLAAIPLLIAAFLLFGDWIVTGPGPYLVGALVLFGAVLMLRAKDLALFVEQLAVPALLVGGAQLGYGLFRDLPPQGAAALLALLTLAVAAVLARPWLRVLLGALAASLAALAFLPEGWRYFGRHDAFGFWRAWHACLALWLVMTWLQPNLLRRSAALESIGAGWIIATLAGLAFWSGMTFLAGASLGGIGAEIAREMGHYSAAGYARLLQPASSMLAIGAALWLASAWTGLRHTTAAGVGLILVALAWFMPSLGAVLLVLAMCATSSRWRICAVAISAAGWIIGSFYYQLHWSLATKAALLAGAGALLGALAWLDWGRGTSGTAPSLAPASRKSPVGIVLCTVAVLLVVNSGIRQKEELIARGQPVYVELAPVDPRSLMQGDYMQLGYRMPPEVDQLFDASMRRPRVVARRAANGVATLLHLDQGAALAAGELLIELTPRGGRWTLVSDAWFFKEGEAERWARAKYGEFRVDKDGRALLVGLRGPGLEKL